MHTDFMDKCFNARMRYKRGVFPLQEFKQKFIDEYARNGLVMIQLKTVGTMYAGVMYVDRDHGFIFNSEHYRDVALSLLREWGFNVMLKREYDGNQELSAYVAQLPDKYLRNKNKEMKRHRREKAVSDERLAVSDNYEL